MNNKKNLTTEEIFTLAVQNHQKNNLKVAENFYNEILKTNPNHFESIYYLGILLAQTKRFDLAKTLLYKAIKIKNNKEIPFSLENPKRNILYIEAHNNLANVLKELGEHQQAISYYEKAIQIQPNYADAHYNLGVVLQELGEHQQAISYYEKAIQIQPNYVKAHNNLGVILKELGEHQKAISYYEKAIQIDPKYEVAYINLGMLFKELGEYQKATSYYEKAILNDPNSIRAINGLSDLFKSFELGNITKTNSSSLKKLLLFLFRKNNINHNDIFHNAKLLIIFQEDQNEIEQIVNSESFLLNDKIIQKVLKEEIFLLMLQKSFIRDKFLEKLLTKIRKEILFSLENSKKNILNEYFNFIISLAEQSFLNEYVFFQSEEEINFINHLEKKILNNIETNELEVAILGCYIPLHNSKNIKNKLLNYTSKNVLFNNMIEMQIKEPLKETALKNSIKSVEIISDDVSKKVRDQYEESPYPRWRYINKGITSNFLLQLNNDIKPNNIEFNNKFFNPNVLIAGCGTGKQVAKAICYQNSNIVGVDLSLTSLAYAKRKIEETGYKNIEFLQGDILHLRNLNRKFDVIECVGVLHHMKEPLEGLKVLLDLLEPHGFLKLGLYSEISRQHIVGVREFVKKKKFNNSVKDIRNCRETIINQNDDQLLQKVIHNYDFYSTSGTRDLIFHVQEHRFTIQEISKILKNLNLEFLGFMNTSIKKKFSQFFPNDKKNISLDNWNQFEVGNPDTFINMYQFWVRKIQ